MQCIWPRICHERSLTRSVLNCQKSKATQGLQILKELWLICSVKLLKWVSLPQLETQVFTRGAKGKPSQNNQSRWSQAKRFKCQAISSGLMAKTTYWIAKSSARHIQKYLNLNLTRWWSLTNALEDKSTKITRQCCRIQLCRQDWQAQLVVVLLSTWLKTCTNHTRLCLSATLITKLTWVKKLQSTNLSESITMSQLGRSN